MSEQRRLVGRYEKVAYLKVDNEYLRMKGFTDMSGSKNIQEYTRRYVDEKGETTDVTGISNEIGFAFDLHSNDKVHEKIAKIFDDEKVGNEAIVEILVVDFTGNASGNSFPAKLRTYTVIADSDGDSTDAYTYSGTFKSKGEAKAGTATLDASREKATAFQPSQAL